MWKADECSRRCGEGSLTVKELLLPLQLPALRRCACEQHRRRAPEVSAVNSVDVKTPRDQRVPQGPKERKESKPA